MSMDPNLLIRKLLTREGFLAIFTLSFGGLAGLVVGIPIIGYVLAPLINQPKEVWRDASFANPPQTGKPVYATSIPIGQTQEASFQSNAPSPWAGTTAEQGVWLRRTGNDTFIAFAIYCPHLGCPVHWLAGAQIFLCPCHGSVFNADGTVAGGPAPRRLFLFDTRVNNGRVQIKTHPLPIAT